MYNLSSICIVILAIWWNTAQHCSVDCSGCNDAQTCNTDTVNRCIYNDVTHRCGIEMCGSQCELCDSWQNQTLCNIDPLCVYLTDNDLCRQSQTCSSDCALCVDKQTCIHIGGGGRHACVWDNPGFCDDMSHTTEPTDFPSFDPTRAPSLEPTSKPIPVSSVAPTPVPSPEPTPKPTEFPSVEPTPKPIEVPSPEPTPKPIQVPSPGPTPVPSPEPTPKPTSFPSPEPTPKPITFIATKQETMMEHSSESSDSASDSDDRSNRYPHNNHNGAAAFEMDDGHLHTQKVTTVAVTITVSSASLFVFVSIAVTVWCFCGNKRKNTHIHCKVNDEEDDTFVADHALYETIVFTV